MRTLEEIKADILNNAKQMKGIVDSGIEKVPEFVGKIMLQEAMILESEYIAVLTRDINHDRLEEICNAERDGRCVVLSKMETTTRAARGGEEMKTIITICIDEPCFDDPQAMKEAVAQNIEHLGVKIRVVNVEQEEDKQEQMRI
jgi:hypothetical protein